MLMPGQVTQLLDTRVKEPDGRVVTRRTELINKTIVKDGLSAPVLHDGKWYVKRTTLVNKTELIEHYYELNDDGR